MAVARRSVTSALLAVSLGINLVQAVRLDAISRGGADRIHIGAVVPPLNVKSSNASAAIVDFPFERPTIVYYFSPSCRWCERNWPSVSALARATRGRYRFVALTGAAEGVSRASGHSEDFSTYWGLSERQRMQLGLSGTPHTLLVSENGRILQSWAGAYSNKVQAQLERYFQVRLPELQPEGRASGIVK